jgi:hypothetical protein
MRRPLFANLALISPTFGGRSVGVVGLWTKSHSVYLELHTGSGQNKKKLRNLGIEIFVSVTINPLKPSGYFMYHLL